MTAMDRGVGLFFAFGIVACSSGTELYLEQEWPLEHTVIALVTDQDGVRIDGPHVYGPDTGPLQSWFAPVETFRVYVRTFASSVRAPNGRPIDECAVHVGPGASLPRPTTAWRTALIDPNSPRAAFTPEPVEAATDLGMAFVSCAPIDRGCDGLARSYVDVPVGLVPQAVATVSDDVALIGGDVHPGPDRLTMLGRVEGATLRILEPNPALRNGTVQLEYNGAGHFIGTHSGDDDVFVVDGLGTPTPLSRQLFVSGVSAGRDGTMMAYDVDRTVELFDAGRIVVERTDVPFGLQGMSIDGATRMLARAQKTIYAYNGGDWVESWEVPLLEDITDIVVDEDIQAAVGNLEHAWVRDPSTEIWERLPHPLDVGRRLRSMAALRGGRFVAVGDAGFIMVWTGNRWCDLSLQGVRVPIRDVSSSVSGEVAYAVGKNERSGFVVRITAPAPTFP